MKKVAVIEGGYSKEKAISIKSAKTVFDNLDRTKFDPIRVLIDENEWTAYDDDGRYSIDKNMKSYLVLWGKCQAKKVMMMMQD